MQTNIGQRQLAESLPHSPVDQSNSEFGVQKTPGHQIRYWLQVDIEYIATVSLCLYFCHMHCICHKFDTGDLYIVKVQN